MKPYTAEGAKEALALLEAGTSFDIAILDYHMPGMDGMQLGKLLKQRGNTFPLVMLSSIYRPEEQVKESRQIFDAFVMKPAKQSYLFKVLINTLNPRKTRLIPTRKKRSLRLDTQLSKHLPMNILVAEDNLINQKLIGRVLEQLGYTFDLAENGLEVLDQLKQNTYHIILMDVQMPEMDGLDATRQIRHQFPEQDHPFIIAMTANAMQGDKERCLDAGMDDYLSKPAKPAIIQEKLQKWGKKALGIK